MVLKIPTWFSIFLFIGFFSQCSHNYRYDRGTMYKELSYPEGRGTLIIFYVEDDKLSEKIRIDVISNVK